MLNDTAAHTDSTAGDEDKYKSISKNDSKFTRSIKK